MKKILILTAGFGDGHNAAARGLREAIELLDEDARAEVLDLFADSYGAFNTLARKTYLGIVQYVPQLWGGLYSLLENQLIEKQLGGLTRLQNTLEKVLAETQPDCVVSTYPIYAHIIQKIYRDHHECPFRFITVNRVRVLGWTNQMPELMMSHHLVIGKAGGATVQEAIAACCPMIVNQVIPGQEEGNAKLIEKFNLGAVVEKNREVTECVEKAFAGRAALWSEWRRNLQHHSRPDAARRIAELILAESEHDHAGGGSIKLFDPAPERVMHPVPPLNGNGNHSQMLLCDFHIHSNYSDGKLSVPEIVDFYGERGFDCICITDHLADPKRLIGKLSELVNFTLSQEQVEEYFAVIEHERQRAWRRYKMLVMTGIEFNKDGYTRKTSAHLLGIDLKSPVNPSLDIPEIIAQIHAQGGLAVASHPHAMKSEWGKNTLYLWKNQERFVPLLDAWEIANRNNIFNQIGLKRLPFIANSDFHKPKHIYSWKTLIYCEKDPEAIKDCIRRNEHVAITLYREFAPVSSNHVRHGFDSPVPGHSLFSESADAVRGAFFCDAKEAVAQGTEVGERPESGMVKREAGKFGVTAKDSTTGKNHSLKIKVASSKKDFVQVLLSTAARWLALARTWVRSPGKVFQKGSAGGKQPAAPGSDVANTQQSVHSKASGLTEIVSHAGMG